jgi:AAA ATPase-like protein
MEGSTLERGQMTPFEIWRAARAGELVAAMTPGAPRGVLALEGMPRAARLIGREATLDALLATLTSADQPTTTVALIGPPGAGKSALAAEAVARAAERGLFPSSAIWLSCAGLSGDPGLAETLDRVARAFDGLRGPDSPRALLALDHLELTLDVAALLDALADGNYALLITARRSLQDTRIQDEFLAPLDQDAASDLYRRTLHQLDPVRPTGEDEPLIASQAQALSGSPLAIEIAAALTGAMGWPLDVSLAGEERDLRWSLERTWKALPLWARRALVGLSRLDGAAFPRGGALAVMDAAVSYLASGDAPLIGSRVDGGATGSLERRANVAGALDALIGLRMIGAQALGRLRMSPAVRQFASAHLSDTPDAASVAMGEAMAGWWLEYARGRAGHSGGASLVAEAPGLIGALIWARATGRHSFLLELAVAIIPAWRAHGRLDELRLILGWSVEAARALDDEPRLRAKLHEVAALDASAGRYTEARAEYAEALALASALGDTQAEALERRGLDGLPAPEMPDP